MLRLLQEKALPLIKQFQQDDLKSVLRTQAQPQAQKAYIQLMMQVIARGLVSASYSDENIRSEIKGFTLGTTIQMTVMPDIAQFTVKVMPNGRFKIINNPTEKADLVVAFKHISLAFLVLTFQESTTTAFARDRMVADGDISDAVRMVRCLNRLEVLILPKVIANLAVKEYPADLTLTEKLTQGGKVYLGVAKSLLPN